MSSNNEPSPDILAAARITTIFSMMYGATFINVLMAKKRALRLSRDDKKPYDRYTSPYMRTADRLQANFLEWSPVFLGIMWSLAATNNLGPTRMICWAYIWLRALYIYLILSNGVTANGLNQALWASTFPGYACLSYLGFRAIMVLFF